MEFRYAKLRARIKEKFGTEGKFAEALGVSPITLSRKFNDRTQFSSEDIKKYCSLLDIPISDAGQYFFA